MKKINFSYNYPKLWGQKKAELIAIQIIDAQAVQINKDLLEYDTHWEDHTSYMKKHPELKNIMIPIDSLYGYYILPKEGKLIQLIFLGDKNIPFCTLRKATKEKYEYYKNNLRNMFEIVVGEKNE